MAGGVAQRQGTCLCAQNPVFGPWSYQKQLFTHSVSDTHGLPLGFLPCYEKFHLEYSFTCLGCT